MLRILFLWCFFLHVYQLSGQDLIVSLNKNTFKEGTYKNHDVIQMQLNVIDGKDSVTLACIIMGDAPPYVFSFHEYEGFYFGCKDLPSSAPVFYIGPHEAYKFECL